MTGEETLPLRGTDQIAAQRPPIVSFRRATFIDPQDRWSTLREVDFTIREGEAWLVRLENGRERTPLADAALGLLEPEQGAVWYRMKPWRERTFEERTATRFRVGRIFEGQAWMRAMTVRDNVQLPLLHHLSEPAASIRARVAAWSKRFGIDPLPATRPDRTPTWQLRLAEWVRAFAVEPELLLLENPTRGALADRVAALDEALQERLEQGAGVLLLTMDDECWESWRRRAAGRMIQVHERLQRAD